MNKYRLILVITIAAFVTFWLCYYSYFGISIIPGSIIPIFSDLYTLTFSVDSIRNGLNPYIDISMDPFGRTYNYPSIWLQVFNFLDFHGSKTFSIGVAFVISFFVALISILNPKNLSQTIICLMILFSPPSLLIIERANTDIIIFGLLVSLILAMSAIPEKLYQYIYALGIFIVSILKLYPIFLLPTFFLFKFSHKKKVVLSLLTLVLIFVYVFFYLSDYQFVLNNTPKANYLSFGRNVFFQKFIEGTPLQLVSSGLSLAILVASLFLVSHYQKFILSYSDKILGKCSQSEKLAFISGCLIYTGIFLIGNNWDYRLIFLFLCTPALIKSMEYKFNRYLLVLLFAVFYFDFLSNLKLSKQFGLYDSIHFLHQSSTWVLFALTCIILISQTWFLVKNYKPNPEKGLNSNLIS